MKKYILYVIVVMLLSPSLLYAGAVYVPSNLSDLSSDSTHRTVTDSEKSSWNGKAAITPHSSVTLTSPDGCSAGWQSGTLASEVATHVAAGVNIDYIYCIDGSGIATSRLLLEDGSSFLLLEDGTSKIIL